STPAELKALQMLGNVTEVALFTERVEVTKKDASEEEIERRLRERLSKFILPEEGAFIKEVSPANKDELDVEINDPAFATLCATELKSLLQQAPSEQDE
ncbi:hypothetical protein EBU58_10610, partial [bacterium]|nr:hypothetical protein [bacterium]